MSSTIHALSTPATPARHTEARLSLALLLYYLGVVLVITLAPFHFEAPRQLRIVIWDTWRDFIANILLFVPFGFLYPLTRGSRAGHSLLRSVLLGLLLSGAIELVQVFEPDRYTSPTDVVTNAAGAGLGTLLLAAASRRIRLNARLVGRLSLELPLMGLLYLLIPLLLLGSWGVQREPIRLLTLVPLGLLGGRVLSDLYRFHFGPAGALGSRGVAAIAGGWVLLGIFPALLQHPLPGAALVLAVAALVGYESSLLPSAPGPERRFEAHAVRRAAPCMAVYLLLIALVPLAGGLSDGRFAWGLADWSQRLGITDQLRLQEPIAALTVLGYLLAEGRGRRELRFRALAPRLLLECALAAAVLEAAAAFRPDGAGSVARFVLLLQAGLLGGWIYHLQRDHVRWLLNRDPRDTPAATRLRPATAGG